MQSCVDCEKTISAKCDVRQIEENDKIYDEGKNADRKPNMTVYERSVERQSASNTAEGKMLQKSWQDGKEDSDPERPLFPHASR